MCLDKFTVTSNQWIFQLKQFQLYELKTYSWNMYFILCMNWDEIWQIPKLENIMPMFLLQFSEIMWKKLWILYSRWVRIWKKCFRMNSTPFLSDYYFTFYLHLLRIPVVLDFGCIQIMWFCYLANPHCLRFCSAGQ